MINLLACFVWEGEGGSIRVFSGTSGRPSYKLMQFNGVFHYENDISHLRKKIFGVAWSWVRFHLGPSLCGPSLVSSHTAHRHALTGVGLPGHWAAAGVSATGCTCTGEPLSLWAGTGASSLWTVVMERNTELTVIFYSCVYTDEQVIHSQTYWQLSSLWSWTLTSDKLICWK